MAEQQRTSVKGQTGINLVLSGISMDMPVNTDKEKTRSGQGVILLHHLKESYLFKR